MNARTYAAAERSTPFPPLNTLTWRARGAGPRSSLTRARSFRLSLFTPDSVHSFQPLKPPPLPLLHVDAEGLPQELAHGAPLLPHDFPDLLRHPRGREKVMVFDFLGVGNLLCLYVSYIILPSIMARPAFRRQGVALGAPASCFLSSTPKPRSGGDVPFRCSRNWSGSLPGALGPLIAGRSGSAGGLRRSGRPGGEEIAGLLPYQDLASQT